LGINSQIQYIQQYPGKILSDFVKCFWRFDNFSSKEYHSTILPDGCCDLIVRISNDSVQSISLTGLWTGPIDVSVTENSTLFAVSFTLLGVEYILQQKIAEIKNANCELGKGFWGIKSMKPFDFKGFIQHTSIKINSIIGSGQGIDSRKRALFSLINQSNGSILIEDLADKLSWNRRQINRYFNDKFGLSLKAYCNILKVFASYHDIKKGELFPQKNYYDQSHFIKEIKKYTGAKPKELNKNKNDRFLQFYTKYDK